MAAQSFERDFGYLMPFIDRVEKAAADLEDASARAELVALVREERQRWGRIRALLAGAEGGQGETAVSRGPPRRAQAPERASPQAGGTPAQSPARAGFTVGPMRRGE